MGKNKNLLDAKKGWVRVEQADNPKKEYDPMDEFTVGLDR